MQIQRQHLHLPKAVSIWNWVSASASQFAKEFIVDHLAWDNYYEHEPDSDGILMPVHRDVADNICNFVRNRWELTQKPIRNWPTCVNVTSCSYADKNELGCVSIDCLCWYDWYERVNEKCQASEKGEIAVYQMVGICWQRIGGKSQLSAEFHKSTIVTHHDHRCTGISLPASFGSNA